MTEVVSSVASFRRQEQPSRLSGCRPSPCQLSDLELSFLDLSRQFSTADLAKKIVSERLQFRDVIVALAVKGDQLQAADFLEVIYEKAKAQLIDIHRSAYDGCSRRNRR